MLRAVTFYEATHSNWDSLFSKNRDTCFKTTLSKALDIAGRKLMESVIRLVGCAAFFM